MDAPVEPGHDGFFWGVSFGLRMMGVVGAEASSFETAQGCLLRMRVMFFGFGEMGHGVKLRDDTENGEVWEYKFIKFSSPPDLIGWSNFDAAKEGGCPDQVGA